MNEQLIKFIELCLEDGVISDKEREVIFRKSKELGVPDDECEILIDSLVSKYSKKTSPPKPPKKKGGFFSSMFNEIKKNIDTDSIKSSFNKVKDDIKKGYDIEKEKIEKELKKIREEQNKTTSSNKTSKTKTTLPKSVNTNKPSSSKFYSCDEVDIIVKYPESMEDGRVYDLSGNRVYKISKTMREKSFKNKSYLGRKEFDSGTIRWVEINPDEVENKLNDSEFIEVHSLDNKLKTPSKKKVVKEKSIQNTREVQSKKTNFEELEEKKRLQKENEEKERLQKENEEKERLQKEKEKEILQKKQEEKERLQKEKYSNLLKEFDTDGNGIIDLVEGDDYGKILKLNQDKIIEINRDYIKQFVQISNYLKTKRKSLQSIYEHLVICVNEGGTRKSLDYNLDNYLPDNKLGGIKEVKNRTGWDLKKSLKFVDNILNNGSFNGTSYIQPLDKEQITEYIEILKDDGHIFNLLLVQSITMVQSLINNDMITFYEIYERLDQLNMFDSKHEKDLKKLLGEINNSLDDIMNEIRELGQDIVSSIGDLSFITEETGQLVQKSLDSVNSSIQTNNLLVGIQTYQMYKINQNTKSLRG